MYSVSNAYKKALKQKTVSDSISGSVTFPNGMVIALSDRNTVLNSLKIVHELCGDYRIGTFNLGYMKIAFFDDSALGRDYSGAEIRLDYEIETENGTETVPMGIYVIDGQTVKRRRNTVSVTAYDYGTRFDCNITETDRAEEKTVTDFIMLACERCGVIFGEIDAKLPNRDITVNLSSLQVQTYRDLVEWCAVLLCGYGVIGRDGCFYIISAKYEAEEGDPTAAIIDKYVTEKERSGIYSTDTRAYISYLSAFCGDSRKEYKAAYVPKDPVAASAVYSLGKNPLLIKKTEAECDDINNAWLRFIDSFMQRGITAELYGDAALDVGDTLRCSGGDIDQRKSIIGVVTKQEWRYRNFHTVICSAAQLSDGFKEEKGGGSNNNGDDEEEQKPQPAKVISQLQKLMEGNASGMGGVGIFVNKEKNAERFNDYDGADAPAGTYSHAEGLGTEASGGYSHAEGYMTSATNDYSHAEGMFTMASGVASHAEGNESEAENNMSHAEGNRTKAKGMYSHTEGDGTTAENNASHAEGYMTKALDNNAHSEGDRTCASGKASHAEGITTEAISDGAHAEGFSSKADNIAAHAEGNMTVASGAQAHAEGGFTVAEGFASHAEGQFSKATGDYSHAGGENTVASGSHQTVIGKYNAEDKDALFIVGNGDSKSRSNALILYGDGGLHVSGDITADGNVGKTYIQGDGIKISEGKKPHEFIVDVKPATKAAIGGVIIGDGLDISENGEISAEAYRVGDGIDISEKREISVLMGEGLELDEGGRLTAKGGLRIENAVVIKESQSQMFVHRYTEQSYISGNKIVFGEMGNSFIIQGVRVSYALNTASAAAITSRYSVANMEYFSGTAVTDCVIKEETVSRNPDSYVFKVTMNGAGSQTFTTYNSDVHGFIIAYENVFATRSEAAPYGYAYLSFYAVTEDASGKITATLVSGPSRRNYIFKSEAEFNSAVVLTNEPQELIKINETVTEG